jgi:glyoxylase-like metal-dependent hydrolase (beta-lactamase superfamily II)
MPMTPPPEYQVYALRYAELPGQRRPQNFIGGDDHDGPMPLDYFMWLIRTGEETILVDTGFDAEGGAARGRSVLETPASLLAGFDMAPADVKNIIITHMHYDHAGNRDLFPNACYHVQDAEMAFATGRCMCDAGTRHFFEPRDVTAMVGRVFEDRVCFHDGVSELRPGITLHRLGGHTAGLQVVRVWTRRGWIVLASDASHFYANMEEARGFPIVHNLPDMLAGHKTCYALADGRSNVIPGHDPLVMARYPAVPGMAGRAVRLDADPL